ncbi:DNA polymerase-3 subunit alpha [Pullulanibacillus pueri]|uniref:DNA polymerase III subunit alpha n=1 Tax=Pullulanibacillus pueri TaxID=1437324 RepID=A0A8J2ZZW4_9BACL|nr:DNA polymerase III subunit alpha [Pullulanibacillus pueri]MBM7683483.1 DNA polymerase-3 subunit alpha [Pullulanibacillus pueri]GGH86732.1 DNA polymerase III subunit alpha [Pullulanibacillus pueri]
MSFTHLHVHSEYSLLDSTCRLEPLVNAAKDKGYQALAITDTNVLYGVIPFYKLCQAKGIKPIIGMEIRLSNMEKSTHSRLKPATFSLILLAKNNQGYRHLVKLSTFIHTSKWQTLPKEKLAEYSEGLIALSSGPDGEVESHLQNNDFVAAEEVALHYKHLFNGAFYLELQDHSKPMEKALWQKSLQLGKACAIPFVATNDVHYIEPSEASAHLCLQSIQSGEVLNAHPFETLNQEYAFKSPHEMKQLFQEVPEAIANTMKIADQCQVDFTFGVPRLPKYPVPDQQSAKVFLRSLCEKGLRRRYEGKTSSEQLKARLDYELTIIDDMGFNDYFLIVWDFTRYARQKGMGPGPGRGSAAGSLVAYVLGITDVDPIQYNLLFERFLNPERVSMPDIDIDFPDVDRDKVIAYVNEKYGGEHVAQIGTFGTLAAKAAIRDMGRVLGLESHLVDRIAREIPSKPGITLGKAYHASGSLQRLIAASDEAKKLYKLASQVEGIPRHTSVHAAGVVISAERLTDLVPLDENKDGIQVTQFPMEVLEDLGLLKMDFLGLRNLTLIYRILREVEHGKGTKINLNSIPMDDPETYRLLSSGDTLGIFQFETDSMRSVLKRLRPSEFEDLVAVNALNRPGPMQFIPDFIEAKHGKRQVTYPHPDLEPILRSTYGIIVYQEQIMQIAATMAGFSLGEADILRRAVSKKKREVLEQEEKHFVSGCLKKGYEQATAETIYKLIVRFADYGFNRSHAVAYTVIAYRLAYLKAHEPEAFMTALLSGAIHHQEKLNEYRREMQKRQVSLMLPSINKSDATFKTTAQGVLYGLSAIKNVGTMAVQEILEKRTTNYKNLFDFCQRVSLKKVNKRAIESLIFAGAMDEFGVDRSSLIATIDKAMRLAENQQNFEGQTSFLDDQEESYEPVPPLTLKERLYFEKEALGLYLSAHPLDRYHHLLSQLVIDQIVEIATAPVNKSIQLAAMIEDVRQIRTKKGQLMAFITLSDQTGTLDAVMFPKSYEPLKDLFVKGELLLVKGNLDRKGGAEQKQFIVQTAQKLESVQVPQQLFLRITKSNRSSDVLYQLKNLLKQHPGNSPVLLYYEEEKRLVELSKDYHVEASASCLKTMSNLLGEEHVILKG